MDQYGGQELSAVKLSVQMGQFFSSICKEELMSRGVGSVIVALQSPSVVWLADAITLFLYYVNASG